MPKPHFCHMQTCWNMHTQTWDCSLVTLPPTLCMFLTALPAPMFTTVTQQHNHLSPTSMYIPNLCGTSTCTTFAIILAFMFPTPPPFLIHRPIVSLGYHWSAVWLCITRHMSYHPFIRPWSNCSLNLNILPSHLSHGSLANVLSWHVWMHYVSRWSWEEALCLLTLLKSATQRLIKPYTFPMLRVLLPKATDSNPVVAGQVLICLRELSSVGGEAFAPHILKSCLLFFQLFVILQPFQNRRWPR